MRVRAVHIVTAATRAANHGLTSLGAAIRSAGPEFQQVTLDAHVVRSDDLDNEASLILGNDPDIVLVSFMSNQRQRVRQLTRLLKTKKPDVWVIGGGHHLSALRHDALLDCIDIQVPGEGEHVINRLLASRGDIETSSSILEKMGLVATDELDTLPLPDVSLFSIDDWLAYPSAMFSRGCPYSCTYCASRLGGLGCKVRWKTPARAIAEIEHLVRYANPPEIYLDDDTLLKNPKWVSQFCSLYKDSVSKPFFCNARPETIRAEVVRELAQAGCAAIGIGIESGSERIRRDILQRKMSDDAIIRAFGVVRDAGVATWSFNMVGIPHRNSR